MCIWTAITSGTKYDRSPDSREWPRSASKYLQRRRRHEVPITHRRCGTGSITWLFPTLTKARWPRRRRFMCGCWEERRRHRVESIHRRWTRLTTWRFSMSLAQGKTTEAETMYVRELEGFKKIYDANHSWVLLVTSILSLPTSARNQYIMIEIRKILDWLLYSDDTELTTWRFDKMMLEGIPGGNKQHIARTYGSESTEKYRAIQSRVFQCSCRGTKVDRC